MTWRRRAAALLILPALLLAWQVVVQHGLVNADTLPPPSSIGIALVALLPTPELWRGVLATLFRVASGWLAALVIGIPLGAVMAIHPTTDRFFAPLVGATYALPKTALIPLFILWCGVGHLENILGVFIAGLLPVIVHSYHGVQSVALPLRRSAQSLGAGRAFLVFRVLLPAAEPEILVGARVALGFAFVLAVSSEMIVSRVGLGTLVFRFGEAGSYPAMFAALAVLVSIAAIADLGFVRISRRRLRWHGAPR